MIDDVLKASEDKMEKSIESLANELKGLRTGRAHPGLLDSITVDYYGAKTPLKQVANVNVEDKRTLAVTPFDKTLVAAIEKAIMNAGLGLNPSSAGVVIRIPLPLLTEERRKDLLKVVKSHAENSRVAIRGHRRDANDILKSSLKAKELDEDTHRYGEQKIQKITDSYIKMIEEMVDVKQKELMEF